MLVRLPNWLGDVCFVAPALEALARAAPRARFVVAGRPAVAGLGARLPAVDATIVLDPDRTVRGAFRAARAYRAAGCDAALVFPRSFRAVLPVAAARVPVRVGFASDLRAALLTHPVTGWRPLRAAHRVAYFGALLRPFGLAAPEGAWRLAPTTDDVAAADAWLAAAPGRRPGARVVAFEPGSHYGTAKRWGPDRFAALGRALHADGLDVVLVGTKAMAPLHAAIAAEAGVPLLSAAGATTVLGLAALLARCDLLVGNDTGPLHLAAAVGTPVLALFGATDPAVCGPRGAGPARVLYDRVACAPCYLETCPVPGHPCLDGIEVARVLAEARALLAAPS
ncbi:MAG: glycosyltransferase family 9 protein [Planctomycetia bacterium]|nr:glycosyltransferase family 9 protein [Planctomycetia bacterium]